MAFPNLNPSANATTMGVLARTLRPIYGFDHRFSVTGNRFFFLPRPHTVYRCFCVAAEQAFKSLHLHGRRQRTTIFNSEMLLPRVVWPEARDGWTTTPDRSGRGPDFETPLSNRETRVCLICSGEERCKYAGLTSRGYGVKCCVFTQTNMPTSVSRGTPYHSR